MFGLVNKVIGKLFARCYSLPMYCHPLCAKEQVTRSRRHSANICQLSIIRGSSIAGDADRVMKPSIGYLSL